MAEPKRLRTRIINKHATAAVWNTKTSLVPLQGELIVYDRDSTHDYQRCKIGDGTTPVDELPFLHVEIADKLNTAHSIVLNGDVNGDVKFDGSKDVVINTVLQGSFTGSFTGNSDSHTHKFEGTSGTATGSYTPSGTVSSTYLPEGSVSTPDITLNQTKKTVTIVTNVGTPATYTPGSCLFPQLNGSVDDGKLSLTVSGGSYSPGVYTPGSVANTQQITYVENATARSSSISFTGKQAVIEGTFIGTPATITSTFTPEGKIEETSTTPEGSVLVQYNNS